MYFQYKRRETKDWHQANRAYMERLTDILGKGTSLKSLSKQDGMKLEDALWEIPANYKKLYPDIPLNNFLTGKQGEYEKISEPTVFNYWMSIRAFFEWCKDREYMPLNILAEVKLNTRRSGKIKQEKRRSYTPEELKILFSCPLFTGHKYDKRLGDGGGNISYTTYYSQKNNPIHNALEKKSAQLKKANYQGIKGIILADGGCQQLTSQFRDPTNRTYNDHQVIQKFLSDTTSISFVMTRRFSLPL